MPIKFSTLNEKNLEDAKHIIGLFTDNLSETGESNCIINAGDFAKNSELTELNTTVTALNTRVTNNDTNAVHRSGDETISGNKTFNNSIKSTIKDKTVPNNAFSVSMGQESSDGGWSDLIGLYDTTNNCRCATIRAYNRPDMHGILIGANNFNNSNPNGIEVSYDSSNNLIATAPTPATGDNSTQIATTAWVNNAVVHKTGTETITGNKTFSGTISLGSNATATTPVSTDNSTKIATTAFVQSSIPASINKFFGKTKPTFHSLYTNNSGLGSGNITLSDDFTNYDMILIIIGDDDGGEELCCEWMPTWLLKYLMDYASKDVLFRGGPNYWRIKSIKSGSGTTKNFIDAGENSRIYRIIGINMDGS